MNIQTYTALFHTASEAAGTPPNPISPPFVALVDSFEAPLQQALLVAGSLPTHVLTHAPAHVPAYIPQAPTSHAAPALPVAAPVASNAAAADSVAVASLRRCVAPNALLLPTFCPPQIAGRWRSCAFETPQWRRTWLVQRLALRVAAPPAPLSWLRCRPRWKTSLPSWHQ